MRIKIFYDSWDINPCGGKSLTTAATKTNIFIEKVEASGGKVLNITVREDNSIVVTYQKG